MGLGQAKSTIAYITPRATLRHTAETRGRLLAETQGAETPVARPRRDAARTRRRLLEAARRRFARDGYATSTVRDIADDAGVNVALISRYFTSKEGLFEACLTD